MPKDDDLMSYAGLFTGAWGKTLADVENTIKALHNEWGTIDKHIAY